MNYYEDMNQKYDPTLYLLYKKIKERGKHVDYADKIPERYRIPNYVVLKFDEKNIKAFNNVDR